MGLESATYVSQLVQANPPTSDPETQGANHLQLIKTVLQNTFPDASKPFFLPKALAKSADYSVLNADDNTLIYVDATAGAKTLTLPTPTNAGWHVRVVKTDASANAVIVAPPAGTISGQSTISITERYRTARFEWNGSVFFTDKVPLTIIGGDLKAATVSLDKLATQANLTVDGNISGGVASPVAIPLGSGFTTSGGSLLATGINVAGTGFGIAIDVATDSTVTVSANVMLTDGSGNYRAVSLSGTTLNLGAAGAVNQLDAGSLAGSNTTYFIYAISNGTTDGTLASTSATSPTMPGGYTYKARIGAVKSAPSNARLIATRQRGDHTAYVHTAGITSDGVPLPLMASGIAGDTSTGPVTAVAIANFVPSTAVEIDVLVTTPSISGGGVSFAPNNQYGGSESTTKAPPFGLRITAGSQALAIGLSGTMILESTNIYWANDASSGRLYCKGWRDNLAA